MSSIADYVSGKILDDAKKALFFSKFTKIPFLGNLVKKKLTKKINDFEPKIIDIKTASKLIHNSDKCAAGERICRRIHKDSDFTESIFLDKLAEGLVEAGKARYVSKKEAINILKKYCDKHPIILSKVSGSYAEICCSVPKNCVYWCMERCGLKCLRR